MNRVDCRSCVRTLACLAAIVALVSWLPQIEGGQPVLDDFNGRLVTPVLAAFEAWNFRC